MLLSVIIPAYNAQDFLEAAVFSVLRQPCNPPEVIVVDDGSTDLTGQIADRLAERYSSVRVMHTRNFGAAHARNLGIEMARGDYIAFLDADDVWCRNAIDADVEALLASGQHDVLSFGYINAEPGLRFGRLNPECRGCLRNGSEEFYHAACRKPFCSYLFRRRLLDSVRFPDGIRYNEDTTFLFLATRKAESILLLDRYLFVYRNHTASTMHSCTGLRYILTDEIPAWRWARGRASCEKDRLDCDGMIYSLMWEYLSLSAMAGISWECLERDLKTCEPFRDVMTRFGCFWTFPEAVEFLDRFSRDSRRQCLEYRLRGIVPTWIRSQLRRPCLRALYLRLKYREWLSGYVDESQWVPPVMLTE